MRVGGTPTFGPRVGGGTPKIAVERKMEQGFHSGEDVSSPQGSKFKDQYLIFLNLFYIIMEEEQNLLYNEL